MPFHQLYNDFEPPEALESIDPRDGPDPTRLRPGSAADPPQIRPLSEPARGGPTARAREPLGPQSILRRTDRRLRPLPSRVRNAATPDDRRPRNRLRLTRRDATAFTARGGFPPSRRSGSAQRTGSTAAPTARSRTAVARRKSRIHLAAGCAGSRRPDGDVMRVAAGALRPMDLRTAVRSAAANTPFGPTVAAAEGRMPTFAPIFRNNRTLATPIRNSHEATTRDKADSSPRSQQLR